MTISFWIGRDIAPLASIEAFGLRHRRGADRAMARGLSPELLNDIGLSAQGELLIAADADPAFRGAAGARSRR